MWWIKHLTLGFKLPSLFVKLACLKDGDIAANILREALSAYSPFEICVMLLTTCFSQEYVSICIYEDKNQSFSESVRMENENCLALHFLSLTLLGLKGFGQLCIAEV